MKKNKCVYPNVDFYHVDKNDPSVVIVVSNDGDLSLVFHEYANDFFDAAKTIACYLLKDAAAQGDITKLDVWYHPLLYLYRHSLELILKSIIFQSVTDITRRKSVITYVRHDLKRAFEKVVELKAISLEESKNGEWLCKFLSDISHIDNASDMFRYPFGHNRKALFDKETHISLPVTYCNMDRAFQIIEAIRRDGHITERSIEECEPKLIIEGGHYYQQSVVGYKYHGHEFYPYFSAYYETGDFLKERIRSEGKKKLFMPMCYLYRNAIELGLKRIIDENSHFDEKKKKKILQKKHSILGLWNGIEGELKGNLHGLMGGYSLESIRKYVEKFHNIDCGSDMFRYPCDKNMKIYFDSPTELDVENVSSCFDRFCEFLDGVNSFLENMKNEEAKE